VTVPVADCSISMKTVPLLRVERAARHVQQAAPADRERDNRASPRLIVAAEAASEGEHSSAADPGSYGVHVR
jgi:hypothetical protein